ncbi:hypothetical protein QVD17_04010 [Tagetes erecta]|uniref:Uncharacterized protein n=1 Tax=Tagetes erecta TaxID=13708 RepID=A0AAD8LCC0_TARER|nr:hypothetical protein QVD17_04010 [Tagetes erecta]
MRPYLGARGRPFGVWWASQVRWFNGAIVGGYLTSYSSSVFSPPYSYSFLSPSPSLSLSSNRSIDRSPTSFHQGSSIARGWG